MDLIERYVNDIGRRLPRRQRDEVRREIRSSLLDALETRAEGEPTEEDQVAVLRELGPPAEVAASYRPSDRYLIGPALYPTFRTVLGVVVTSLVALFVLIFAVQALFRPAEASELGLRLLGLVDGAIGSILSASAIIVFIFAALQRFEVRPGTTEKAWDPRTLPIVRDHDLVSRGEAVAGIVIPATVLSLLYVFRDRVGLVKNPGGELLLNDVFRESLPLIALAVVLGIAVHTALLLRGRWQWTTRVADFAVDLFVVWILYRIAMAVAERERVLLEAGIPEPVPGMIVGMAWSIVAVVLVLTVAGALKNLYLSIKGSSAERLP